MLIEAKKNNKNKFVGRLCHKENVASSITALRLCQEINETQKQQQHYHQQQQQLPPFCIN